MVGKERVVRECVTQTKMGAMMTEEKMFLAQFYVDHRDQIEGKFEGASNSGKSRRNRYLEQAADQLVANFGVKRTVDQVKQKFQDMKKKMRKKLSAEVSSIDVYSLPMFAHFFRSVPERGLAADQRNQYATLQQQRS